MIEHRLCPFPCFFSRVFMIRNCGASISGLPNPVPLTTSLDLTALRFDHGTFDGFSIDSVVSSLSVVSNAFRNVYLQGETIWNLACYCHFANFVTSSLISFDTTVVAGWFQHVSFQIALWKIRDTNFRNLNWLETTNAKLHPRSKKLGVQSLHPLDSSPEKTAPY